jgi:hypothetical protein
MILRPIAIAVAAAAFLLAAAASLRYAESVDMLAAGGAKRSIQVLIGLGLAAYANFMPKQLGRARRSRHAESRAQALLRFGGWSLTLGGLAYAGLWAFAPLQMAGIASMTVVAAALIATLGYALLTFAMCRSEGDAAGVGR